MANDGGDYKAFVALLVVIYGLLLWLVSILLRALSN